MAIQIRPMTESAARIISDWRYPGALARYDVRDSELLCDDGYYEATDGAKVIGFFCFDEAARVPGYSYDDAFVDFGLGLNPELVGRGLGRSFCEAGLAHLRRLYPGRAARLSVAQFHIRAIRAYSGAGFLVSDSFTAYDGSAFFVMTERAARWLDVGMPLSEGMAVYPGDPPFVLTSEKKPWGMLSRFAMSAHCGTHVDAPAHFIEGGGTTEGLDVARLNGACLVTTLDALSDAPAPFRRILIKAERGLTGEEADSLAARGAWLVGVNRMSVANASEEADIHRRLLRADICILENLVLDGVADGVYELMCLPLAICGCEGSPTRAFLRAQGE